MNRYGRCLLLVCIAALCRGETAIDPVAEARTRAKATWSEAAKAQDLWGCLMLEEWGREQKPVLRLGPVLLDSVIYGRTVFAVPEHMRSLVDLGDRVLMATDRRAWLLTLDGRPMQPGVVLSTGWAQAVGFDGGVIASGTRQNWPSRVIDLGSTRMADGRPVIRMRMPIIDQQDLDGIGSVADDGSAIACAVPSNEPRFAPARSVWVAIVNRPEPIKIPNAWSPIAVGRNGAWVVIHNQKGQVLVRGDEQVHITWPSAGPGVLACFLHKKPVLVLPDGKDVPLPVGRPLGGDARMMTIGNWLVLATGSGVKTKSDGGIFGDNAGQDVDLPASVMLWRWTELAADPTHPAAETVVGQVERATQFAAALWIWSSSRALDLLDLTGKQSLRTKYIDTPSDISWPWTSGNCLVVRTDPTKHMVYGPDKSEIWTGECDPLWVKRPDLALTRRIRNNVFSYQLQRMSADRSARKEIPLDVLPPVDQGINVGFRRDDWLIAFQPGAWRRLDLAGKLIDQGVDGVQPGPPGCQEWDIPWETGGRFYRDNARAFPKAAPSPSQFNERLLVQDAWRFGPVTILIDDDYHIQARSQPGRKHGEWNELGEVTGADHLALAGSLPVIANGNNFALASLIGGPALNRKLAPGLAATDFGPGPWRINDMNFVVPRGHEYVWDGDHLGFWPHRLRSPDDASLLVITRSVLIELEGDAARLVGRAP